MSWQIIRPQIKTLLESVSLLQEVSSFPKLQFQGYPSAYVIPSDNSANYETNNENTRIYAFTVRLFYETKTSGVEGAINALEEVVDAVLDAVDNEDQKGSSERIVGVGLDSNKIFLNIFATPSVWGELPDYDLLMAELSIRVRISVDISN